MATKKSNNQLVAINNEQVAAQLRDLAERVQSGEIGSYEFKQTSNSVSFSVDSADGTERVIKKQTVHSGLVRDQTDRIRKQSPEARREVVKALAEEEMSQVEIANRTMVSQKTISNDIKRLKKNGELKS